MADLLKWHHATVTTCHSKTKDLAGVVSLIPVKYSVNWRAYHLCRKTFCYGGKSNGSALSPGNCVGKKECPKI